jgi:hypothetical protein
MQTLLNVLAWAFFATGAGIAAAIYAGLLGPSFAAVGLLAVAGGFSCLEYTKPTK